MAKLRKDLRELQAKNAQVALRNEKLETEIEALRKINENLWGEMKEPVGEGRTVDAVHASAVGGARRQPDPSGNMDMCAQSEDIIIPGNFALLLGRSSEMRASMLEALPADVRNRMEEHANNSECCL
jgi:hypothetical protein